MLLLTEQIMVKNILTVVKCRILLYFILMSRESIYTQTHTLS